jgi:hypothetical protein
MRDIGIFSATVNQTQVRPVELPGSWFQVWKNFWGSGHTFVLRKSNQNLSAGEGAMKEAPEIRGGSPAPFDFEMQDYLLMESLFMDPPLSIFTLITWISFLSA